jgi:hypothetical protein
MIFLTSPLTHANPEVFALRLLETRHACAILAERGEHFISPVLMGEGYAGQLRVDINHAWWMVRCLPLLEVCEAVHILPLPGWSESRGLAIEVAAAKRFRLPVINRVELAEAAMVRAGEPSWRERA